MGAAREATAAEKSQPLVNHVTTHVNRASCAPLCLLWRGLGMMHSDQVLMFLFTLCRLVLSLLNSARHIVGLSMTEGDDAVTMERHQKLYGMSVVI